LYGRAVVRCAGQPDQAMAEVERRGRRHHGQNPDRVGRAFCMPEDEMPEDEMPEDEMPEDESTRSVMGTPLSSTKATGTWLDPERS
jgi:hypothetical protein